MSEKAHLSRKQIKQPDEFLTLSRQALAWAGGHQRWVLWGAVAVAALLVVVGIASAYRRAQERDANADLARAMAKLSGDDASGATIELREVAKRWNGTSVGGIAALLAANSALRSGRADDVLTLAAQIPVDTLPPYLRQQLLLSCGAALEAKQEWLAAAARYQEAATLSGPYTAEAIVGEARNRELGGERDKARELYRQAYDQFPDLPGRDLLPPKFQS